MVIPRIYNYLFSMKFKFAIDRLKYNVVYRLYTYNNISNSKIPSVLIDILVL